MVKKNKSEADFGLKKDRFSRENLAKTREKLKEGEFLKPNKSFDIEITSKEVRPSYMFRKKKKKTSARKMARKIVSGVLIFLAVALGITGVWGHTVIARMTDGKSGFFSLLGLLGEDVRLKTDSKGRTNILVFGTSGYEMSGSGHDGAQLTDSIMLVSFDQDSEDLAMVSLPRDLYIGETCTSIGKVNELYMCGLEESGTEEAAANKLISAVEGMFGVNIQYRVHVDWSALIQIVDSLGGITVTLDEDIADSWTETYIKAGIPTTLNGERALGLARARHGTTGGDFTRGNSQQKILIALQDRIIHGGVDITQAISILNAIGDNVRMNFTLEEIKSIVSQAKAVSLSEMRQVPLTGLADGHDYLTTTTINKTSYVVPTAGTGVYDEIKTYLRKMLSSDAAEREMAKILVLNGSGIEGEAAEEQATLIKAGYNVAGIGDAPDAIYPERYTVYQISREVNGTIKKLEARYNVTAEAANRLPLGINTNGVDIVVIVGQE